MAKCNDNWRKPGHAITDRGHRYRAQRCVPAGPRHCALCRSTRFLVVDHKDSNERNDSPRNLRWLCKSCNNRLGAAAAKAGIGHRTNPGGAKTFGEYIGAVLRHERGKHDEGGSVIHKTPKERRQAFAAEVWKRRKQRGNQAQAKSAEAGYAEFHGRAPSQVIETQEAHTKAGDYFALGELAGLWLTPVSGDPETWTPATIQFDKRDAVKLAADPAGQQLYLIGGVQKLPDEFLHQKGAGPTHRYVNLGTLHAIAYVTQKRFDGFSTFEYAHEFGEETGERPDAWYCRESARILIVGGAYTIAPLEETLGASPGIVN